MRRRNLVLVGIVGVASASTAFGLWKRSGAAAAETPAAKQPARIVPVQAAQARAVDMPIVLAGLGTVVPRNSVTVKSRVNGQLLRVLFREGDLVEPGQALAELDVRPFRARLTQVEGQLARDRAQLDNARIELGRAKALAEESLVSGQEVAAKQSLVEQVQGAERTSQGLLDAAGLELSFTRVTAPIRGRIGFRQVDAGNNVSTADSLAVIHTVQPIDVRFALPEDAVPIVVKKLREAEKTGKRLEVEAWEKGKQTLLARGHLLTVDNEIDAATGTVKLKAEFKNDEGLLFPNQFVNIRFVVDVQHNAVVVPAAAVQRGREGPFVYVVKDGTVAVRKVTSGAEDAGQVAIRDGLMPGDAVVLQGADQIREGSQVKVVEAPAQPGRTGGGSKVPSGGKPAAAPSGKPVAP